jgi:spermidine synthase
MRCAAVLNLLAAAAVLVIAVPAWRHSPEMAAQVDAENNVGRASSVGPGGSAAWSFRTWAVLYGIAGFQALSLEILWFRLLGVMLKSSAFTFGTLLTIYLGGLGLGAAMASVALRRIRRPALAFLLLQAFIGLYAGASIAVLLWLVDGSRSLPTLAAYFAGYEPLDAASAFTSLWRQESGQAMRAQFATLYLVLPAVLVAPPTIAMGASFPLLQKVVLTDVGHIGRRVGLVLIANIAGSTAGSILTGWVALNWLGSAASLLLMTALSGLFLAAAIAVSGRGKTWRWRAAAVTAALAVVGGVTLSLPGSAQLWAGLHGSSPAWITFAEDASGVSLLKSEPHTFGNRALVFVNGIGQSWIPYGNVHSALGALPAFIHPNPREAAIIGLGSGDTLYSLAGRLELTRVTCIEIIRPQLATLGAWAERSGYPALSTVLFDPRIDHVYGDGRIYIMRSERRFDIIEADALRPTSAYSGNLYSEGYFALLRSRLAPGGLAVTWSPTSRVHDTFAQVFPYVLSFGHIVLGSNDPIRFSPPEVRARMRVPAVRAYYERAGIDVEALLTPYLDASPHLGERPHVRAEARGDLNQDLFPRDEFSVPRR